MGRYYAYCRISKPTQSILRQVRNITAKYPNAIVIKEAYTGTTLNRPLWTKLLKTVRAGDTIIFDSVSRMSRDSDEGYAVYETLFNKNISLVFLKEPQIDTDTYRRAISQSIPMTGTNADFILEGVNNFLLALAKEQILLAFEQAEKEVSDLQQRTREGIETARLNGKRIGTPKGTKLTTKKSIAAKKIIEKHSKTFGGFLSDKEVIKLTGLARGTYFKYKRELKASLNCQ